ncbi:bifunctional glutamate N-acetyltransferase/amino-acid acetyltransferase ArgJ [Micrococcoides hystricis]|uniref:Arginine biosynthesis bifunctional protein ArgJ n=1 Tax=Micrococcoides hystricis TaxID=1572761 RepID=A0ABV6P849_9MICC
MSVTTPQGFVAAGIASGIKTNGNKDLALVVNQGPDLSAAAVFTANRVAAAPVHYSRTVIADGQAKAVVLNSGGANACTGKAGYADTVATAERVADRLGTQASDVLVCSTGLIGERLPMQTLLTGVDRINEQLTTDGGTDAAEAIMTTDTVAKTASASGTGYSIGGMAKGAGMLAPELATMLVVLTTDAKLSSAQAEEFLNQAMRVSFNRVDADGCMSTNDTVVLMASGASSVEPDADEFQELLDQVTVDLAKQLVADAEGASHEIEITVVNAASEEDAEMVARTVSRSALFKTAIFGNDPNWGRVVSAVGTTSAEFDPDMLDVTINGVQVCRGCAIGEPRENVDLSGREVSVEIDLHAGDHSATLWTIDLTHDYVEENSAYSS